jgi:hypothetical protein
MPQSLLASGAPVVLAGDYNVVPTEADLYPNHSYGGNALLAPKPRGLPAPARPGLDRRPARHPSQGPPGPSGRICASAGPTTKACASITCCCRPEPGGPTRRRRCRSLGARPGRRQRPRPGLDRARPMSGSPKAGPLTPDGRYLVVRGRLWRTSNPALSPERRQALVDALMAPGAPCARPWQDRRPERLAASARPGPGRQGRAGRARSGVVGRRRAGPQSPHGAHHALCRMVRRPGRRLAPPCDALLYLDAMPPRTRPTARLLTPAGWAGLAGRRRCWPARSAWRWCSAWAAPSASRTHAPRRGRSPP